jgi:hypothetical protein
MFPEQCIVPPGMLPLGLHHRFPPVMMNGCGGGGLNSSWMWMPNAVAPQNVAAAPSSFMPAVASFPASVIPGPPMMPYPFVPGMYMGDQPLYPPLVVPDARGLKRPAPNMEPEEEDDDDDDWRSTGSPSSFLTLPVGIQTEDSPDLSGKRSVGAVSGNSRVLPVLNPTTPISPSSGE